MSVLWSFFALRFTPADVFHAGYFNMSVRKRKSITEREERPHFDRSDGGKQVGRLTAGAG